MMLEEERKTVEAIRSELPLMVTWTQAEDILRTLGLPVRLWRDIRTSGRLTRVMVGQAGRVGRYRREEVLAVVSEMLRGGSESH